MSVLFLIFYIDGLVHAAVTPLLTHWSYCSLEISHRYYWLVIQQCLFSWPEADYFIVIPTVASQLLWKWVPRNRSFGSNPIGCCQEVTYLYAINHSFNRVLDTAVWDISQYGEHLLIFVMCFIFVHQHMSPHVFYLDMFVHIHLYTYYILPVSLLSKQMIKMHFTCTFH